MICCIYHDRYLSVFFQRQIFGLFKTIGIPSNKNHGRFRNEVLTDFHGQTLSDAFATTGQNDASTTAPKRLVHVGACTFVVPSAEILGIFVVNRSRSGSIDAVRRREQIIDCSLTVKKRRVISIRLIIQNRFRRRIIV